MVVVTAHVRELRDGNILVLTLPSQRDVDDLKDRSNPGKGTADFLKKAVAEVLGFTPLLIARVDGAAAEPAAGPPADRPATSSQSTPGAPTTDAAGWATVSIPGSEPDDDDAPPPDVPPPDTASRASESEVSPDSVPTAEAPASGPTTTAASTAAASAGVGNGRSRYGEAVVREILGANFIEEQPHSPRVVPGAS